MQETVYSVVTPSKYLERQYKGEFQLRESTTVSSTLFSTLHFLSLCLLFLFLSFFYLTVPFTFFFIPFPFIPSPFIVRSVQYGVSLLFAFLCYFLITRLIFLIFFLGSFSYFVCLLSVLCFCVLVMFCVLYLLLHNFCTSLLTTPTVWKPNCDK